MPRYPGRPQLGQVVHCCDFANMVGATGLDPVALVIGCGLSELQAKLAMIGHAASPVARAGQAYVLREVDVAGFYPSGANQIDAAGRRCAEGDHGTAMAIGGELGRPFQGQVDGQCVTLRQ